MTTPVVAGRASGRALGLTSHSITLPGSISVGELLVVIFAVVTATATISTSSSGWSLSTAQQASNTKGVVLTKVATGSDALTVSTSTLCNSAHTSYQITGAGTITVAGTFGASATSNDPPSVTPAAGSADYLYIAAASQSGANNNTSYLTGAPTGYSNFTVG
jgi:hypothetical protein